MRELRVPRHMHQGARRFLTCRRRLTLTRAPYGHLSVLQRAQKLLDVAEELDCCDFTSAKDIVKGHQRLNLAFTATIFNEYIGM